MASYLGLQKKFLPNLKQYEATTGRPISDKALQGYLYAALQTEADRADQNYWRERQFGLSQQGLDIQKKAAEDEASAAKISGITQLAGLPIQGALGYGVLKQAGLLGAKSAVGTSQGLLSGGTGTAAGAQTTLAAGGPTTAGELAAYDAAMAEGAAAGVGSTAGTGTGYLSAAIPYVGPAAAGFLGAKFLGGPLDKILPGGGKTGKAVGGAAGGAMAGAALGSVVPGVGTLVGSIIGGAIGLVSSLF